MRRLRLNFIFVALALLFTRCTDFYSTSLWYFQSPEDEMNPLSYFFGAGWNGLILTNVIIVALILSAYYYHLFKYKPAMLLQEPKNLREYWSLLYFNQTDKFYWTFYRLPKNWKPAINHIGFVGVWTLIIGSILATIHNLCEFYHVAAYDNFKDMVKRPLFVMYGLMFLTAVISFIIILKREYRVPLQDKS